MVNVETGGLIESARMTAGLSRRVLAELAGIPEPMLARTISGDRTPKMPELVRIALATDHTVAQLTGVGTVADRVQCVGSGPGMEAMRGALVDFLELNDYLAEQAVPETL